MQRYKMKDFYPQAKGKPSLADKGLEHHIFISLTDVKRKCWKQKTGREKEYKSPKAESFESGCVTIAKHMQVTAGQGKGLL